MIASLWPSSTRMVKRKSHPLYQQRRTKGGGAAAADITIGVGVIFFSMSEGIYGCPLCAIRLLIIQYSSKVTADADKNTSIIIE